MRTAAPEKWEARMHGGCAGSFLPAKNKTARNMRVTGERKRNREIGWTPLGRRRDEI